MDYDAEMKQLEEFKKEQRKRLAKALNVSPEEVAKMSMYDIEQSAGLIKDRYDSPPYRDDPSLPPNFTDADRHRIVEKLRKSRYFEGESQKGQEHEVKR